MAFVELITREGNGQVVVSLRGELDVAGAASVAAALAQVAARTCQVIVDLEGLDFIDSSGLAALVRARKHARHAGGDLLLAAPQRQVLRVLAITRVTDTFSVHACVEDAVGSPGRSAAAAGSRVVRPGRRGVARFTRRPDPAEATSPNQISDRASGEPL
jgi:anti-sigma B factor antagonist